MCSWLSPLEDLSVLDVVNAVEPLQRITGCPLSLASHCETLCPAHTRLDEAIAHVEEVLKNSTIHETMFDPSRPLPLSDDLSGDHVGS